MSLRSRLTAPEQCVREKAGQAQWRDGTWRDEVDAELELGFRRDVDRDRPRIRVRIPVRNEGECRAAASQDLEGGGEAPAVLGEQASELPGEDEVAGPRTVLRPPARLEAADRLGVDPDARGEPESATVDPPERDSPGAAGDEALRGADGVSRQAQRTGEHVCAASR